MRTLLGLKHNNLCFLVIFIIIYNFPVAVNKKAFPFCNHTFLKNFQKPLTNCFNGDIVLLY